MEKEIIRVFGKDCRVALAVSRAENGTRQCDRVSPQNKNGSYDLGIFQINTVHTPSKATIEQLKDCKKNIQVAKRIFDAQGWQPWVTYKTKAYLKHL